MDTPPKPIFLDENTPDGKEPQKYVRTFSGDMETVQAGGTPDLAPLKEKVVSPEPQGTPLERIVASSPIPETPPPSSPVVPEAVPSSTYVPPTPLTAPLKTYGSDFSERMKETEAAPATVLAAEQDQAPRMPAAPEEKPSRANSYYILGGVALLLLSVIGAYFAYASYRASRAPVIAEPTIFTPIFVDEREEISGTGTVLSAAITGSMGRPLARGNVRLLYASTTGTVFSDLRTSAPDILVRNTNRERSMAGIVNAGGNQTPFFILSVSSYSNTFGGMLSWETTMPRDLALLYPPYPQAPQAVATSSSQATTTPVLAIAIGSSAGAQSKGFRDEVVSNHDVRIYRDETGKSVLLYGYWNQTTLIIAREPAAFAEIAERLSTSRTR